MSTAAPMYTAGRDPAKPGADLRLSVDLDLQQAMVTAFGDKDGSAVAVDPRTGEILAMVSLPGYDTNLFVNGISHTDYSALMDDPSRPLFNRNVLGGGPPGSTVKPLIALAGLDSGLRTPEYKVFSTGIFYLPGQSAAAGAMRIGGARLDRPAQVDLRSRSTITTTGSRYEMGIEQIRYLHVQVRFRSAHRHRSGRREHRRRAVAGVEGASARRRAGIRARRSTPASARATGS